MPFVYIQGTLKWVEGRWGECARPCRGHLSRREVACLRITGDGNVSTVPHRECIESVGYVRRVSYRPCNLDVVCPSWFIGEWRPCDRLCNEGVQRRDVVCRRRRDGRVEVLEDDECAAAESRPESEQTCMERPCDGVAWVTSEWTACNSCVSQVRTRVVKCATRKGLVVEDRFCSHQPRPVGLACNDVPSCEPKWYTKEWSKCSVQDGESVRSREVYCGLPGAKGGVSAVHESLCADSERPADRWRTCGSGFGEKCPNLWLFGPWGECLLEPGDFQPASGMGWQYRRVLCGRTGREPPDYECYMDCDALTNPDRPISMQPCSLDEGVRDEPQLSPAAAELDECAEDGPPPPLCKLPATTLSCSHTRFGCCPDMHTPAKGPFDEGCPAAPRTCAEAQFGCCPDGLSAARGPARSAHEGCVRESCTRTLFGCCRSDKQTAARGNCQEGCPPAPPHQPTSYDGKGCADNMSEASATEIDGDVDTTEPTITDTTMTDLTVSSGAEETATWDRTGITEITGTAPTSITLPPLPALSPQCPEPDNCQEPDRPDVCYLSIDVGTRRRDVPRGPRHRKETRFAYDSAAGKCTRFRYKGAGGNQNNFLSEQACVDFCRPPPPPETAIPASCTDNLDVKSCGEIVRSGICQNRHFSEVCCKSCAKAGELDPPAAA